MFLNSKSNTGAFTLNVLQKKKSECESFNYLKIFNYLMIEEFWLKSLKNVFLFNSREVFFSQKHVRQKKKLSVVFFFIYPNYVVTLTSKLSSISPIDALASSMSADDATAKKTKQVFSPNICS